MEAVNGGMLGEDKGGPPPPSPLTGCYLLVVVGEPHSEEHKDVILQRVAKGLLSWDVNTCLVNLEKELSIITDQGLEGEEARYGERLIQFASENLVTEILIHPAVSTLSQCVRNLLSSFTRHRHIIHAGYTFQGNGSWAVQDGTFSYSDFSEAFQEIEVQRVIHAYENGITLDLHCGPEGDWTRLPKETFTKACKVRVNPTDVLTTGSPSISNFIKYLTPFLVPTSLENVLESSDVVGNIRFSRPTLYVFPGGQGDAALFGINGFNMLLDGGYSRKACFWDFVRHLDRLDAVLMTRLNNSSICGISSVLKRKKQGAVYPQVGHFFCNIQERKSLPSPDGDKDKDLLIFSILEEGQNIVQDLQHLNLNPQPCYRDQEPIILYHKVGHGTLNMYVLSPDKNSREVREFLQKWNQSDAKMFAGTRGGRDFSFPLQNLVSICALLVWQPANPNDTITRILYPGSTPQKKIFDGFDRLKNLECIKHPLCSEKSLAPVKKSKQEVLDKLASKDKIMNEKRPENKLIEETMKNGEMNGDVVREKQVKKSDSLESDKEKKIRKSEDKKVEEKKKAEKIEDVEKIVENGGERVKAKPKSGDAKPLKKRGDSQHRKKPVVEKKGPTTPKKTVENKTNGETKDKEKDKKTSQKPSPSATPAKSTKDANNRRVIENKKTLPKKELTTKPAPSTEAKTKPERKPISRRPKTIKGPPSPMKKMTNGVQKPDSISKRGKLDKEGTTDSSTVSTPSADQDSVLKKDISKLTPEEIQQLKDKELDELKEEQEAVKEIEAVFRKGEGHVEEAEPGARKIKDISIDDNLDTEEYLIIEKEEIEHDSLDQETKEDEMQKLARDSEESEKQRKLSSEEKEIDIQIEVKDLPTQETRSKEDVPEKTTEDTESKKPQTSSPEDKGTPTTDKKELVDDEVKEIIESHPEEKVSANVESGATTTAPTLPEDERITLDDIKEDNGQPIEEKHVKEETKEKEVPVIHLPPQSQQDSQAKMPLNVGISLDKQKHIRDIVKTPDEVADLPVHEEADFHEFHGDGKKNNESDLGNENKEDKKVEEKQDKKESIDESKDGVGGQEKDVKEISIDDQIEKEVQLDVKKVEKSDKVAKKIDDLEEIAEKKIEKHEPKKEVIDELFAVKEIDKDISKDIKTESQTFLDQEKAAHDFNKQAFVEKTVDITENNTKKSVEKADETQKFEILEKAELETKENVESDTILLEKNLKESIDDEWVVITKEEEDKDKVETAQEAEKAMEGEKEDDHKQDLNDKVIEKHEPSKPKKEALPAETKDDEKDITTEKKVVPKQDVLSELPIPPDTSKVDANDKEKEIESEGECDDHHLRKEDEIQEILEKDKEDIKALIDEADTKILSEYANHQKMLDDSKNTETSEITKDKIIHTKETQQEVAAINDKIQELKRNIDESVEEISFSRTKRDLTKIEGLVQTDLRENVEKLIKIDDKLQELKHSVEEIQIEKAEIKIEKSIKSPEHAEQVTLPDSSPDESDHLTFGDLEIDKIELGRKSPAEREEDVKKIVVSVAEVLKSEAPLEEFQGKLPFTQELRETHITTQDSPIIEAKVIITDDIPPIPEEPAELKEESSDIIDKRKDLIAGAQELMAASSKVISDIRSKSEEMVDKVEETLKKVDDKLDDIVDKDIKDKEIIPGDEELDNNDDKDDKDDDSGTVHRMLVTASSEDGGEEIEICPVGTIIFSKSSESSGRSSPEPSQKTQSQKSSIVETLSDTLSTVKQITEKDLDIEKEEVEDPSVKKHDVLDSMNDAFDGVKELVKENIEDISKEVHKTKKEVREDVSDVVKSAESFADNGLMAKAKKVGVENEQTQDGIEDFIIDVNKLETDINQEVNKASKEVADKAVEVLGTVSSTVQEPSAKAKSVSDKEKSKEEEIKVSEVLTNNKKDSSENVDKMLSESKDVKVSTTDKMEEALEKVIKVTEESTKELNEIVDASILETGHLVTSATDETIIKTEKVGTQLEEGITEAVDKALEVNDKAVDKSKDILTDVSNSSIDTKDIIQEKTECILKTPEEIEKEIKEVKDKTIEKPEEILTDISSSIADIKEGIKNKTGDAFKTTEEVKDSIKVEIKEVKEEAVDKSKESLTDIFDSVANTMTTMEDNVNDALTPSEEVKDLLKKEIKDDKINEPNEILAEISGNTTDIKETKEIKVGDALKLSEESKDSSKEEVKSLGELVGESEKLVKKLQDDLPQSMTDIEHELDPKEADVATSPDLKEKLNSSSAQIKNLVEETDQHIFKDTQKIAGKSSEELQKEADKIDETVVSINDKVANDVEALTGNEKHHEVRDDILTKIEAMDTESSKIDVKAKDEIAHIGSNVDEKCQDRKEKISNEAGDISIKIDKVYQEAREVIDDKVKETEANISHLKDVIKEQSQEDMDKSKDLLDKITDKIEEDQKKVKDVVVESEKDVTDKISDLSASVLDVTEKIEETIGIKADDNEKRTKLADSEKRVVEMLEDKLAQENATIIVDEKGFSEAQTKESTPERRGSVIEKAEELLEKSEQVIGSVFSAIGHAAESVLHEILPDADPKISGLEIKSDKAKVENLAKEEPAEHTKLDSTLDMTDLSGKSTPGALCKDELLSSSPSISGKSTPDIPKKEHQKEVEKIDNSGDNLSDEVNEDISASVTKVAKTAKDTIDNKVVDIEENIIEKDDKVLEEVKDLTIKTEHQVDHDVDIAKSEETKLTDQVVAVETAAKLEENTLKKGESVVEMAEEFLEKTEKSIMSTFTDIGDAVKSVFKSEPKSSENEIKMDEDHIKKDTLEKFDATADTTKPSDKSSSTVSRKDSSLEASPGISRESTPELPSDKTAKETEELQEKLDRPQDELEVLKSDVLEIEDQKLDGSNQCVKKSDAKDDDKISPGESVDHQEHGIFETADKIIEKSEKVVETVFSAIEEAAKSIIHDVIDGKNKGTEKESHEQKEKPDDKKEYLQQEEKEIEDKSKPLDSSTSDKNKVDKESLEKKINNVETVIFEKCKPSDGFKIDNDVLEKEDKHTEDHLKQSLEDSKDLSQSISSDKCPISKDDKVVQKQIDTFENTLEQVSDMTKSIVLEKEKHTFDVSATEKKDTTISSSDVVIDSNKLRDMQGSSHDKCEKEELVHEEQEKKDPEKEHDKLEDKAEEKLLEIKLSEKSCEETTKLKHEPPKQDDKKAGQPVEVLEDPLTCDMTKSIYVEKNDSSPESHKLDDNISETSKQEKGKNILKTDDTSPNAKDSVVLEDQHISSQTEKCEKESMEKTLSEKDSISLKVERTEPKKLSISDVEISIKTDECPKDASQSFLDNERILLRDNIDAKVYICPASSQEDDKASVDEASSSSILQAGAEAPTLSDKSSPDLELSGKSTPPTVPVSPIAKEVKSSSSKLDSGLSEQTETDDEDLSTKSQVAHSQSDLDELDMKMDPMSMSFYGTLPEEQVEGSAEVPATLLYEITKAKYATELKQEDQDSGRKEEVDLMTASFIGKLPSASSESKPTEVNKEVSKKDAVDSWGKPLGLPAPTYLYEVTKAKFSSSNDETDLMTCSFIGNTLPNSSTQHRAQEKAKSDPMTTSVYFEHSSDSEYDPIASWGKPLGLPSPAPPNDNEKGTPKKERKLPAYVTAKNKLNDDKKRAESPSKLRAKKISPVYVDLTYVPHHGNHNYCYVDFFKKIRARYYVFSGLEPSRQVYDALLEAKQTWEDKELEVTIIPTYDTDILGYWVAENEEILSKLKIDLSPSASRCTINLQDHETSCSAYRLEF